MKHRKLLMRDLITTPVPQAILATIFLFVGWKTPQYPLYSLFSVYIGTLLIGYVGGYIDSFRKYHKEDL